MFCENLEISFMSEEDIEGVVHVEQLSFSHPWSVNAFREMLEGDRAQYVVAKMHHQVVGMCGLLYSFEEAEVSNVAVHPDYRGRGIAKIMLLQLLGIGEVHGAEVFSLEVRVSNKAAIKLYKSVGFEIEATRKNCYTTPTEDGYIMWKR